MKNQKRHQVAWGVLLAGALGGALLVSPFTFAFGGSTGGSTYSGGSGSGYSSAGSTATSSTTSSWTPSSGYQQDLSSSISSNTPGFQSAGTGQYTYNGCAARGDITAYNATTHQSYCRSGSTCPAGEHQINGDGVCQGTGSNSPGTYAQWTFSACQNGTQTEWSHNVNTDAITSTSQVSCVLGSPGSTNPANTSGSSTASNTAPSCTPSASTSYGGTSWTGCARQGVESGTQSYTVYHSCPSYTSYGSRTLTQSTSTTCQAVVEHQCAYAKPGYAQSETCLTSPLGGTANCSGWSTPYYDPHGCPIPTPVN